MDIQTFLTMGGHGFYVWSSFGIVAVVMLVNVLQPLLAHRRLRNSIQEQRDGRP